MNATNGRTLNNRDGRQNQNNQLKALTDVIIDRESKSLVVADTGSRRVIRWSRQKPLQGQTIISDIDCWDLGMHRDGSLYVSDRKKNEVRRWKKGETNGIIVASGNGQGDLMTQLSNPRGIIVDRFNQIYVVDCDNARVMRWCAGAKE